MTCAPLQRANVNGGLWFLRYCKKVFQSLRFCDSYRLGGAAAGGGDVDDSGACCSCCCKAAAAAAADDDDEPSPVFGSESMTQTE